MKTIIITILIMVASNQFAIASDYYELEGKKWQRQCTEKKQSLASCCADKKQECLKKAKNKESKKACKKKAKACRVKTIKIK